MTTKARFAPWVLEALHELLREVAPAGEFHWGNKQLVHLRIPQNEKPWASLLTKKTDGVWLQLTGPRDKVALGRIVDFADQPSVDVEDDREIIRMRISTIEQARESELKTFLAEHLSLLTTVEV